MEFQQFIQKLEVLRNSELPGIKAHQQLAPKDRVSFSKYTIPKNAKKAGVLILFYPNQNNQTQILLTKRATYKGKHSNQISFPGGKQEKNDMNLQNTSLREAFEEVGVQNISILKQMTTIYIPTSNFSVNPYLGYTTSLPHFIPNYEVDTVVELPLDHLLYTNTLTYLTIETHKDTPCFHYKGHIIWGATAMILNEVKELIKTSF